MMALPETIAPDTERRHDTDAGDRDGRPRADMVFL